MFSSSVVSDLETSLMYIPQTVTPAMNDTLTRAPSASEVKAAVFAIHSKKAPGPDGMTALFYQNGTF